MAIQVADGFSLQSQKPIDARLQFNTVAAMKAAVENTLYNGCFAYVVENKKYYSFDSSNTADTDTGKWREFSGGGGSSYTAGDGINIDENNEISTDNLQSGDIADCLYPLPTPTPDVISLGGLTDVALTDPTNGQVLKYNSTTQAWENGEGGGGGTTYTAGDGINIDANNEISTDNLQSGDMDDVLNTLPSIRSSYREYSTTEQVIGQWIDGRPLYEKVITGSFGTITSGTYVYCEIPLGFSLGIIMFEYTYCVNSLNTLMSFPNINGNTSENRVAVLPTPAIGATSVKFYCSDASYSNGTLYSIIRYTKSTD